MTEIDIAAATQEPIAVADAVEDMAVMRAELARLTAAEEDLKAHCTKLRSALADVEQYAHDALTAHDSAKTANASEAEVSEVESSP